MRHNRTILETLGRHPIHPFPARMAPGIALDALGEIDGPITVLDPMAGSGTVLAVARANGHRAIGFDLDPLAVLLAGVWTRSINPDAAIESASEVLHRAKGFLKSLPQGMAYPINADEETRRFIRYWFDGYARRQLSSLAKAIRYVDDKTVQDALWVGFSRLIITKTAGASRAMDLSHSRPHREFLKAPVKPFDRFLSAISLVVSNCPRSGTAGLGPVCQSKHGDARRLAVQSGSIDLVLTSPPYLNAIDYLRCSKFSLVWMGHRIEEIRTIRSESIGAESRSQQASKAAWVQSLLQDLGIVRTMSERDRAILARYVWDMGLAIAEVSRVLKRGGRAVYVVGDSSSKGAFVRNSAIVSALAESNGLNLVSRNHRTLPANRRYMPPPKKNGADALDVRLRKEVILRFEKP
jgi:DNA modification methylase